jgi:hypothetical protein
VDKGAAASEVHRVLAPGRFVAAVWHGIDRQPLWKAMGEVESGTSRRSA